jgi:hypothetical protein
LTFLCTFSSDVGKHIPVIHILRLFMLLWIIFIRQIQVVVSVWFPQFGSHLLFLAVGCGNFPVNSMFHQTKTCNVVNVKAFVTLREMPPLMVCLLHCCATETI